MVAFHLCTTDDIPTLVAIAKKAYPPAYTFVWKDGDPNHYFNLSFTPKVMGKDLLNPNVCYYIIHWEKEPIGFFKLNKDAAVQAYSKEEAIELEKIYLLQESAGKGIGGQAIAFIIELARKHQKKVVWLDVMTVSQALKFYEKLGFRTVAKHQLTYSGLHDHMREMQRMVKLL